MQYDFIEEQEIEEGYEDDDGFVDEDFGDSDFS